MNPIRPIRRNTSLLRTASSQPRNEFQPFASEGSDSLSDPPPVVAEDEQSPGHSPEGVGILQIKRSISPDGRIDSISLEIDLSIDPEAPDEIRAQARDALELQTEIIREYLNRRDQPEAEPNPPSRPNSRLPQPSLPGEPARLLEIGVIEGKWGPRYFINVGVANQVAKLWGTPKQLVRHLLSAGHVLSPEAISDGLRLGLPCRATTQRSADGRFLNAIALYPTD